MGGCSVVLWLCVCVCEYMGCSVGVGVGLYGWGFFLSASCIPSGITQIFIAHTKWLCKSNLHHVSTDWSNIQPRTCS
ncbi:hypothetical protein F5Y03DRAFT_377230 [Xylaria venustula]|nr:hypothetical protein F5Y03DRAFT_377230 [Xylaria venustula]